MSGFVVRPTQKTPGGLAYTNNHGYGCVAGYLETFDNS